ELRREPAARGGHGGRGRHGRIHPADRPVRRAVQPALPRPVRAMAARRALARPTGSRARACAARRNVHATTRGCRSELTNGYEIAVIGAGPCGLGVGVAASRAGVECVLFDRGCTPRPIAGYPTYMTFLRTAEKLELGGVPDNPTSPPPAT